MQAGTSALSPGGLFRAEVLMEGIPQQLYSRRPDGRLFTAGVPGTAYAVRVTPASPGRLEALGIVVQAGHGDPDPFPGRPTGYEKYRNG